jgi:hypothetical protein
MASSLKLTNNGVSRLAGNIAAADTTLSVTPGDGSKFPAITGSEWFPCTLVRASDNAIEIVKVTTRSIDTFTITRAQEGTAALALVAGDRVELRLTAGTFTDEVARVEAKTDAAQTDATQAQSDATQALADAAAAQADATQALSDAATADAKAVAAQGTADAALPKAGGTMTGALALAAGSTAPNPVAGDRSQALATTQMFADEFGSSLATSGYQKLPSGLIIQWGQSVSSSAGNVSVTFPIEFPTAVFPVTITHNGTGAGQYVGQAIDQTTTGFSLAGWLSGSRAGATFGWIAVGH